MNKLEPVSATEWLEQRMGFYEESGRTKIGQSIIAGVFKDLRCLVNDAAVMTSRQRVSVEDYVKEISRADNRPEKLILLATYINSCK